MPIGSIISGAGSLLGGLFGSSGAKEAAELQANSLKKALQFAKDEAAQTRRDLRPFVDYGTASAEELFEAATAPSALSASGGLTAPISPDDNRLRSMFSASPGYDYQMDQMIDAVQNSAAGKSGAVSGNMLRALQEGAQGLASGDWWKFYDRLTDSWSKRATALQNLTTGGISAGSALGTSGASTAGNIGQLYGNIGSAQAAGTLGASNAWSNAFQGLSSSLSSLFNNNSTGGVRW